jgi:signal transduction histidine kinase/ligand-binding sensor domain-containing protein
VGTAGGGVSRFDGQSWKTYTAADGLASDFVQAIALDLQGALWVGTAGGGVSRFDGQSWKTYTAADGLASDFVVSAITDNAGRLWFGTWSGVSRFDGTAWISYTPADGLSNEFVLSILEDRDGRLWFGTDGGGVSLLENGRWSAITPESGRLGGNRIYALLEDREGQFWFGTNGGVSRYDGPIWTTFTVADGLVNNSIYPISEDGRGNYWFGTVDQGLSVYDGQQWTTLTEAAGYIPSNRINVLYKDRSGALWIGTDEGVSRYDERQWKTFTADDGLSSDFVLAVFQDADGNIWFGTDGGVSVYDGAAWATYSTLDGLASDYVQTVFQDSDGILWFGTNGGVNRFDGIAWTTFTTEDGLIHNQVRLIFQDTSGALWFATNAGVSRYAGQQWQSFTMADGLAANDIMAIQEDPAGTLWFGTAGGGVSRYDSRVFQTLNRQDGLAGNVVHSIYRDRFDALWLGTNGGVSRYRLPPTSQPHLFIDAIVADRRYEQATSVELPSTIGLASFEFHAISLKTRDDGMVYRYRLVGYDPEWKTTRERRVEYADLPLGDYRFEIQAIDRDLFYSETPSAAALTIHFPYIWLGWGGSLVVAIAMIAWQANRLIQRDRRIREANESLTLTNQALQEKTHDLEEANTKLDKSNQDLNVANQQVEKALKDLREAQSQLVHAEKMSSLGQLTAGIAHELNNPINFVSANVKPLKQDIHDILEILEQYNAITPDDGSNGLAEKLAEIQNLKEEVELDYVIQEVDQLMKSITDGATRVADIVRDLRNFSRLDEDDLKRVDLHEGLDATLKLLTNQLKTIQVIKTYGQGIPEIDCYPGQINQVWMNILTNAVQAMENGGEIRIRTEMDGDSQVRVTITDTGCGMTPEVMARVFEPFFTTRDVGQGTGLGMSVTYGIIQKHSGTIEVASEVGKGTTLTVTLPLKQNV